MLRDAGERRRRADSRFDQMAHIGCERQGSLHGLALAAGVR
jgi:hypothetical protein